VQSGAESVTELSTQEFDRFLREMRPKLHRYGARMTGSAVDGEDVVQEAMMKAIEAFPDAGAIENMEGWLFRIVHNVALDRLRRRARHESMTSDVDPDLTADRLDAAEARQIAATSLRTFMRLPAAQRSSVILMDVLGYSLAEIGVITESSIPAIKAALHRGRDNLRVIAQEPDDAPPAVLSERERSLLAAYVDRFNARDFDAIRDMLADEVRLELVNKTRSRGRREVVTYFQNYSGRTDWHLSVGSVDGRPGLVVRDPNSTSPNPAYFILLEWQDDRLAGIRDFRYARYAAEGADLSVLE
jgi:RNA polymerase sigma-70 factor, ECF subfamily